MVGFFFVFLKKKSFSVWGRQQRQTGNEFDPRPVSGDQTFPLNGRLAWPEAPGIDRPRRVRARGHPAGDGFAARGGSRCFHGSPRVQLSSDGVSSLLQARRQAPGTAPGAEPSQLFRGGGSTAPRGVAGTTQGKLSGPNAPRLNPKRRREWLGPCSGLRRREWLGFPARLCAGAGGWVNCSPLRRRGRLGPCSALRRRGCLGPLRHPGAPPCQAQGGLFVRFVANALGSSTFFQPLDSTTIPRRPVGQPRTPSKRRHTNYRLLPAVAARTSAGSCSARPRRALTSRVRRNFWGRALEARVRGS